MIYMYEHCFLPLLPVFVMKCCVLMHCSLPHNPYCCSLPSPMCMLHLLICTYLNSSSIACTPAYVSSCVPLEMFKRYNFVHIVSIVLLFCCWFIFSVMFKLILLFFMLLVYCLYPCLFNLIRWWHVYGGTYIHQWYSLHYRPLVIVLLIHDLCV